MSRGSDARHLLEQRRHWIHYWLNASFPRGWVTVLMTAVCCLSACTALRGQSDVLQLPHRDRESWPEMDMYYRAGRRIDLTLVSQARLSTGVPNPALWLLGVDASIVLNHHLLVTPSYYYFRFDQAQTTAQGHNLVLAATFSISAGKYVIDDRNRVVGFLIPNSDFWVYGN